MRPSTPGLNSLGDQLLPAMKLTREQRIAVLVGVITLALILFVTVFRNGTSW